MFQVLEFVQHNLHDKQLLDAIKQKIMKREKEIDKHTFI